MASRSFKPASYLASAAQAPNRSPRPSFTRTSSASSTASEDSLLATLRGMKVVDKAENSSISGVTSTSTNVPGHTSNTPKSKSSSSPTRQFREDTHPHTPGRKRSQPIAIELPRKEQAYTPLSARGDLPGGYFPNHEEVPRIYRSHPFGEHNSKVESPIMSASSSLMSSPASETTPKGPMGLVSPSFGPLSPSIPEPLVKPMGKYHPANYQTPTDTEVSLPTSAPRLLPPTNLSMPTSNKRSNRNRTDHGHERKSSDVKRKLQQYQRDMIAQARSAASQSIASAMNGVKKEPDSPRLQPAGSPGPITPFELEDIDNEGYIAAGNRARQHTLAARGYDRDRQDSMNNFERVHS